MDKTLNTKNEELSEELEKTLLSEKSLDHLDEEIANAETEVSRAAADWLKMKKDNIKAEMKAGIKSGKINKENLENIESLDNLEDYEINLSEIYDEMQSEYSKESSSALKSKMNKYYPDYNLEKSRKNIVQNLDKYAGQRELFLSSKHFNLYQTRNYRNVIVELNLHYKEKDYSLPISLLDNELTFSDILRTVYHDPEIEKMVREDIALYCNLVRSANCTKDFAYIERLGVLEVDSQQITEAFVENLLNLEKSPTLESKRFISMIVERYQDKLRLDTKMMIFGKSRYPMSMVNYYSKKDQDAVGVLESLGAKPRGLNKLLTLCVKAFRAQKPVEVELYSTATLKVEEKQMILKIKQTSLHLLSVGTERSAEVLELSQKNLTQVINSYIKISPELRSVVRDSAGSTAEQIFGDLTKDILAKLTDIENCVNMDALKSLSIEKKYLNKTN